MPICETCWRDAHARQAERGGTVYDNYVALLRERQGTPCQSIEAEEPTPKPKAEEPRSCP